MGMRDFKIEATSFILGSELASKAFFPKRDRCWCHLGVHACCLPSTINVRRNGVLKLLGSVSNVLLWYSL